MNIKELLEIQEAYSKIYSPIDELYKGKHGQSDAEYQAGRSDAGKRISGDEKTGPRHYTLGRARGAAVDPPTAPGARPVNTPKLSSSEKEYHQYNKSGAKRRAEYSKVGGSKGLPEEVDIYDIILSHLLDEGYADTQEAAETIMVTMSNEWREEILDEAKDETEIGISGLPVPKRKMSPKKRYEFEKKRRENLGTNVGGTKYSSGMAKNGKCSR